MKGNKILVLFSLLLAICVSLAGISYVKKEQAPVPSQAAADLPDLTILEAFCDQTAPRAGNPVDFIVSIKNEGEVASPQATLILRYRIGQEEGSTDIKVPPLKPGSTKKMKMGFIPEREGLYSITVEIDFLQRIEEIDEDNNTQEFQIEIGPAKFPDLTILEANCDQTAPRAGNPVDFIVSIKNEGEVASPQATLILRYRIGQEEGSTDIKVPPLKPDSTKKMKMGFIPEQEGLYSITVEIDFLQRIEEIDEDNNTQEFQIEIGPAKFPDLTILEAYCDQTAPRAGKLVGFIVSIKNEGEVASPQATLILRYRIGQEEGSTDIKVPPLKPDSTKKMKMGFIPEQEGTYSIGVEVDFDQRVKETDEGNNIYEFDLEIGPAEVEPEPFEPQPSPEPTAPVYIMPSSIDSSPEEQFEVNVHVESEWGISEVEIEMAFDPDVIEVVELQPGDLLGSNPIPGIREIDNQVGTLIYSLSREDSPPVPTPPGVFATVNFRVLESALGGSYGLMITSIILIDQNSEEIQNITAQGAEIRISARHPSEPEPSLGGEYVFYEDFETDYASRWFDIGPGQEEVDGRTPGDRMSIASDYAYGGSRSLKIEYGPGDHEVIGWMHRRFFTEREGEPNETEGLEEIYMRTFVRLSDNFEWNPDRGGFGHLLYLLGGTVSGLEVTECTVYLEGAGFNQIKPFAMVCGAHWSIDYTDIPAASGPSIEKGRWHCLEIRARMNDTDSYSTSRDREGNLIDVTGPGLQVDKDADGYVIGVRGHSNGIIQVWMDGQLVIDKHDALLRITDTGLDNTPLSFHRIAIGPYFHDGVPSSNRAPMYLWVDELAISTQRIGCRTR